MAQGYDYGMSVRLTLTSSISGEAGNVAIIQ